MECHSKLNVTEIEGHSNWNVTQNGMSLKIQCYLKCNVIQKEISLKMKGQGQGQGQGQNGMAFKMESN